MNASNKVEKTPKRRLLVQVCFYERQFYDDCANRCGLDLHSRRRQGRVDLIMEF